MLAASIDAFVVPSVGNQGDAIAMSAQASSTISGASLTYTWDFGDGSNQSGVDLTDVSHAYTAPSPSGSPYVVSLTVSDGDAPASATSSITIDDVPPTISAGPSQTVRAGDTVQFSGSASDAGGSGQIASIQWDFNYNGSSFNADPSANGNLTPSHAYTTPGTYVVAMQATDQSGAVSQDFTAVTVKPTDALIVNAGPDVTTTAGQSVTLSGSYSDPGGTVSSGGIAWDTNYNGSSFNPVVTGTLTPNVSFSTPGTYQVALRITDSTSASDISILNVTVQPVSHVGPTATAGTDQSINEGSTAAFNGSYTDPDGTVSSSGIAWDFNYDGVSFNPMTTGTLTPTYQFTTPGDYTVALQITDSNGLTGLSTLDVTVNAVPPTVSAGSNLTVTAGQLVQMSGSASVPSGANDPLSYAWDFNYDGTTFNPGSTNTLNPYQVFATPGTYTVALQATDSEGVSSLSTITVTVNASNSLVVDAGPDQALNEGDTATFSGSWTDANGTVSASTAQWDFNYDGHTFVADPSANGTLTPSYQFTTPGTYLVALQLTDSNNVTSIGTLYVTVADVPPTVDAGVDQTVNQGATVQFAGSASVPTGANDPLSYAWDFDYDGNDFVAAPNTNTLTPTYVYTTPGTYEAALQVTDAYGQVSLETATITVNDVPPTATVSNSGPVNAGSAVTFTVSNLQDQTPGDTPTYLVDWTGSGQFEELTSDDITTNPDGSISFTHTYDTPSGPSGYNAVVQIVDGSGGSTNYTSNVVVNDPTPSVTFRPNVPSQNQNSNVIDATVPFVFNVTDPSLTETQAGFTYFVSLDGGAYTSSNSPLYLLPSNISMGSHTVTGYVQDSLGVQSAPVTWTGTVQAPVVTFKNVGSGQLQLNWTGGSPVTLNAGQSYSINGTAAGLSVTLLSNGATYVLETNGSIDSISAGAGVLGVQLTVDTGINYPAGYSMWVGDGHVGTISLPQNSMVTVSARGDLGSIAGPWSDGTLTGVHAADLIFANLDGSITGVDSIGELSASGWLGTSASQVVESATGIGSLSAYGVGATVLADAREDAGDNAMQVTVGAGGVPGEIDGGNVSGVQIAGDVNVFKIQNLEGNFDPPDMDELVVDKAKENKPLDLGNVGKLIFDDNSPDTVLRIKATSISLLDVKNSLKVTNDVSADAIWAIQVGKNLSANSILAPTSPVSTITVGGDLTLTKKLDISSADLIKVAGNMEADVRLDEGYNTTINVGKDFTGDVLSQGSIGGGLGEMKVGGNFSGPGPGAPVKMLLRAKDVIGSVIVTGNIQSDGGIEGGSIGLIESTQFSILVPTIKSTNGDIYAVLAKQGKIEAAIIANKGNISTVDAETVAGSITAKADPDQAKDVVFSRTNAGANVLPISGSISYVHSHKLIPQRVRIQADWWVGQVIVDAGMNDVEKCSVLGQAGNYSLNAGGTDYVFSPIVINVGAGKYLGTVTMTSQTKYPLPDWQNGDPLLTVKSQTNQTVSWQIKGPPNGLTTILALVFGDVKGIFGIVNKKFQGTQFDTDPPK